jgi:ribose 5-phosphate isomerase A
MNSSTSIFKKAAAHKAVSFIKPGMIVGLGHGSTAAFAVNRIAELLHKGLLEDILCIPCSKQVERDAQELDIPLTSLDDHPVIDITIDGADEVDNELNLIKGGGGALLREKIVAQASRREIIIIDESKLSPVLGTRCAVPVEVVTFGLASHKSYIESLGALVRIRAQADEVFKTDHGNVILDCVFHSIDHPEKLSDTLKKHAGIVEHGLFLGIATDIIVSGASGITHLTPDI